MKPAPDDEDEVGFLDRLVNVVGMPDEVITIIWERKQKVTGGT